MKTTVTKRDEISGGLHRAVKIRKVANVDNIVPVQQGIVTADIHFEGC